MDAVVPACRRSTLAASSPPRRTPGKRRPRKGRGRPDVSAEGRTAAPSRSMGGPVVTRNPSPVEALLLLRRLLHTVDRPENEFPGRSKSSSDPLLGSLDRSPRPAATALVTARGPGSPHREAGSATAPGSTRDGDGHDSGPAPWESVRISVTTSNYPRLLFSIFLGGAVVDLSPQCPRRSTGRSPRVGRRLLASGRPTSHRAVLSGSVRSTAG
jgi:hypothetical protein